MRIQMRLCRQYDCDDGLAANAYGNINQVLCLFQFMYGYVCACVYACLYV